MLEYIHKGFTGRVNEGRVTVHSPEGHIIVCRPTEIVTEEGLQMLVEYVSEVA